MRNELITEMLSIDIKNGTIEEKERHCYLAKKMYIYNRLRHLTNKERESIVNSFREYHNVFDFLKNHELK